MYPIPVNIRLGRTGWLLLLISGYGITSVAALKTYIQPFSVNFVLGIVSLFFTLAVKRESKQTWRFAVPALAFGLLYLFIPAKTVLFASMAMAVFFAVETFVGKINYLVTVTLILMSPIAEYATNLFSFPIRLMLTSVAGNILKLFRPETFVEGNIIITKASEFSVDPACMGLHMLIASLLAGVMLIAIFQRRLSRVLTFGGFILCMLAIFFLNILSNLIRILCLVQFNIGPDSIMHEIAGIVCMVVYVIVPAVFITRFVLRCFGKEITASGINNGNEVLKVHILQNVLLLGMVIGIAYHGRGRSVNDRISIPLKTLPGYTTTRLQDGVTKFENDSAFVYVKPIAGFYSSDHQPMICWSGSGYEFKKVRETKIAGRHMYDAVLRKQDDVLYTAWWYDNGDSSTISQFEWRWNSLKKGDRYFLVNVTAATPAALQEEIRELLLSKSMTKILVNKIHL
jgi:exosortase N